jgi:hypothetical protein
LHAADPDVSINEDIIYATINSSANISAVVLSLDIQNTIIQWFHEGSLIDTAGDPLYTVSTQGSLYTLTIARVEAALQGNYEVVVTNGNKNQNDSVLLAFPGK